MQKSHSSIKAADHIIDVDFKFKKVKFQPSCFLFFCFFNSSYNYNNNLIFSSIHTGMGSRTTSTDEMLETENNRMVDDLAAKVSRLKGVCGHKHCP